MINEVSKQNNSILLYILTHSSIDTDKEEKIDMINVGIKNLLINNKCVNFDETFNKLRAYKDNCIFVNFHSDEDKPIYGINELFGKLSIKDIEIYNKYILKKINYNNLIMEINNNSKNYSNYCSSSTDSNLSKDLLEFNNIEDIEIIINSLIEAAEYFELRSINDGLY